MLTGVRVVELAIWVAGPGAGGILADWGAEVIKVEGPAGDPMRSMFASVGVDQARVPPYELDNRGKRCVMLDLREESAREDMHALLAEADVFLTNLRPDALERLGLDHESITARYPKLIYASVTGYGLAGPDRDRAGYDVGAFWARSSIAHSMVPPNQLPPGLRSGLGDHTTGITIVSGICAALFERTKSGRGRLVHTSLLRTGVYVNGWDLSIRSYFGKNSATRPRTESQAPLINCYAAGDGRGFWLLGLEQDRHWPGVLAALEHTEWADDPRFRSAGQRAQNAPALIALMDEAFSTRTYDEWIRRFDQHDVWFAPINSVADTLADPQVEAAGAWGVMAATGEGPGEHEYRISASPVGFAGWTESPGRIEELGQSTEEILRRIGRR
jgi:crotonobetainyl-CoA:carnitine CoA-transferase CaiB-like acyl-CoA transferase